MKQTKSFLFRTGKFYLMACCLLSLMLGSTRAATLVNFPFNEGTNYNVLDTAQGLSGYFGTTAFDPTADTVSLMDDAPSGAVGDRSFANSGRGFLIADDSATAVLDITNGPITMESWIKINSAFIGTREGIISYGNSYKIALRNSILTFTLLGKKDITNSFFGAIPIDSWVHVASVWQPGVGVNFYITSPTLTTNTFVADTNTTARPLQNNFLSVGNEGFSNPLVGSFDRVKIHHAALTLGELDNDPVTAKPDYVSTKVSYQFNESDLPSTNSLLPALPLNHGNPIVFEMTALSHGPSWTNDTPAGLPGDFALAFNLNDPTNRQRINVDYAAGTVDLRANNTNYTLETWVKLPAVLPATRMVLFRTLEQTLAPTYRASLSITAARALQTTVYGVTDFVSGVIIPDDQQWHHVAVVMENYSLVRFYLDGVLRQTMNRTSANAPTGSGSAPNHNLLIGLESDALYFKGLLDRIRISNDAVSNANLDAAPIAGAPFISSQPTNVIVTAGANVAFNVAAFGNATLEYQWRSSPTGNGTDWSNIPGETGATLTFNNVQNEKNGFYSVVVSNSTGVAVSSTAQLTVTTFPIITAHPTNLTLVVGNTAEFSVTATPAAGFGPLSYQWRYGIPGNPTNQTDISGATSSTFTLNNVQLTNQGFYSVIVSNNGGFVESTAAKLTITAPGTLQPLWRIMPGERPFITGFNATAGLRDLERGMAYNPVTDHLLIGARVNSTVAIKGIFIINAADGADVGQLPNPAIVNGGTIWMTRVVAAEDGAIFACNFGTLSDAVPLKIYRWGSETSQPTVAYSGNPVTGTGIGNQQWGKNMIVRGSGTNTQILMDTRNKYLALFTTTDGTNFNSTLLLADSVANDDWGLGMAWGEGDTFYGKASGKPFYQWELNLPSTNVSVIGNSPGFPSSAFSNFGFSEDGRYMAGLIAATAPNVAQVELYDMSYTNLGPITVDIGVFTSTNTQSVGYGNVYIANNRVFALNPNNGISAFTIPSVTGPILGIRTDAGGLILFWPSSVTDYILEGSDSLTTPNWTTVTHSTNGNENQATVQPSGAHKFYRLKK